MEFIAAALGASLVANVVLLAWLAKSRKNHKLALEAARKAPTPTLSAEELLHDLTAGSAIVRIERLNPSDLFLRSPRT